MIHSRELDNRMEQPADLTDRQREVLQVFRSYLDVAGERPPVRLLARRLRLHHTTVQFHLEALARKGWLDRRR